MPDADRLPRAERQEQVLLDELARVQRELEETRSRRRHARDAFQALLMSSWGEAGAASRPVARTADPGRVPGTRKSRAPDAADLPHSPALSVGPAPPTPDVQAGARASTPAGTLIPRWVAGLLLALVLTGGVLFLLRREGAPDTTAPAASFSDAAAAGDGSAAEVPTPKASATAAPAAELVALRRVWVRVTVDGERVLERELAADARVPLDGAVVVIRAGDGGAVQLWIGGENQGPLGGDGAVVNRTFTTTAHPQLSTPKGAVE